jgi:hypothetical protein
VQLGSLWQGKCSEFHSHNGPIGIIQDSDSHSSIVDQD